MHPNQFFNHVTMLDESFIPGGAQALLASAHPKNFLPVPVRLPVYRIKIRFQTGKRSLQDSGKIRSIAASLL